ncbi:MAG: hypothetical protein R3C00_03460 [Hyphomonas sp.]|nr:hypothetical protein [Hyphomonas sp.]MCB9960660.1 glycosyl transferase [Hyphomonas sp.]
MSGGARIAKPEGQREAGAAAPRRRVAFFGHDVDDAAVRRRVQAMQDDGIVVTGFMMRRGEAKQPSWPNTDLGLTRDGAFLQRLRQIFRGARTAAAHRDEIAAADVIYARNLDMLACAFLAKRHARIDTPVIYESLDVHRLLTRNDIVGRMMRWLEGSLLRRTIGLVVSSPGFLRNHFERHYPGQFRAFLVENRLAAGADYGPRPRAVAQKADGKLSLGWVGILRCRRSFEMLCRLADQFPDTLEIHMHGIPARIEIPVFEPEIDARPNVTFHGRYKSPEDLAEIYGRLDLVWAGDFMEAGYNSVWLLPNRIYEGGYYTTPSIAPAGTQTAAWLKDHDAGIVIDEPLEETLPELVRSLLADRSQIGVYAEHLAALPRETFVQPHGFISGMLDTLIGGRVAA